MKIWIVKDCEGIFGVYATEAAAKKAKKEANWQADMEGKHGFYGIEVHEIQE